MLAKLLAALLHPRVLTIIGLLLLLLVIFQGGRILDANGYTSIGTTGLLLICVLVLVLAGGIFFWRRYQAMKRSRAIEQRLRAQAKEQAASVRPDRRPEIEALEKQLQAALDALKTSRLGRGALYGLPWYIIVGPPGSGKTTLLQESGLNFPYTSQAGRGLRGVGGTRNCDWWFTDQGILLDTAGRYTTEAEDHDEWLAFLQMLRRARKRKPINGAIVCISIDDVVSANDDEREEHASKIRHRIDELTKHLQLVCPVYLVFTKCDLLDGFVPFFENMTREQRAQVWGVTLPFDQPGADGRTMRDAFVQEFDLLYRHLGARRLALLTSDRPSAKQQRVFAFPLQLAAVRDAVADFVRRLCQPNPYHEGSSLRGFYFTSGTQEGAPIDRVLRHMAEALGVPASVAASDDVQGKSYFIDHLFTEVIFPDQDLARSSARVARREQLLRKVTLIGSIAAAVVFSVLLIMSYVGSSRVISESQGVVAATEKLLAPREQELLAAYEQKRTDHWRTRREPDNDEKGALAALATHFVKLHETAWGLLGKSDRLYDPCRQTYIRALREYFLNPMEGYLRESLNAKIDAVRTKSEIDRFQNHLFAYQHIAGKAEPVDRERLANIVDVEHLWNWRSGMIGSPVPAGIPRTEKVHLEALLRCVVGYRSTPDWTVTIDEATRLRAVDQSRLLDRPASEVEKLFANKQKGAGLEHLVVTEIEQQTKVIADRVNANSADTEERRLNEERASAKARELVLDEVRLFLLKSRPPSFPNLTQAAAALSGPELTNPAGPPFERTYRDALSKLRAFAMSTAGSVADAGAIDWIREAMKTAAGLKEPIDTFIAGRNIGARILADVEKNGAEGLRLLTQRLALAQRELSLAANNADTKLQDAVRTVFVGYVGAIEDAMRAEAKAEVGPWWDNKLGIRLSGFATKYPFSGSEPLSISDFTEVFNPVSGSYAKAVAVLEKLAEMPLLFALSAEFKKDRQSVRKIQAALFHGSSATLSLPFHVRLSKHGDLDNVEFALKQGDAYAVRFDSGSGNIDNLESVERRWTQECRQATVRVRFAGADWQTLPLDTGDSAWSLFRLMATGQPPPSAAAGLEVGKGVKFGREWPAEAKLATGAVAGSARILLATLSEANPFEPGFFKLDFHPPVAQ